ncbi:hypothetical protein N7451_005508 [Penicillium sp. IBT 35674x]|nr:hypothetical protein N7451_005508 [Penicillium sp. IBT 35674x]
MDAERKSVGGPPPEGNPPPLVEADLWTDRTSAFTVGSHTRFRFGDDDSSSSSTAGDQPKMISRVLGELGEYSSLFGIELDSGSDLDPGVMDSNSPLENLKKVNDILRHMTFHLRYGDYAGRLWKCLGYTAHRAHKSLPSTVTAFAEMLKLEERIGEGDASSDLQVVLGFLNMEISGLGNSSNSVSAEMAKAAIKVYATRNRISHADVKNLGARDQHLSLEKDVKDLGGYLLVIGEDGRDTWTGIVNFWEESREWLDDERARRSANQSRFLAIAPSNAVEKEEFKHDLEKGMLRGELDSFYEDGGARRPNIPPPHAGFDEVRSDAPHDKQEEDGLVPLTTPRQPPIKEEEVKVTR